MVNYDKKLEKVQNLLDIKRDIQASASDETMLKLWNNFNEEYHELATELNSDKQEITKANDWLNYLDKVFFDEMFND